MTTSVCKAEATPPRLDPVQAVATFFREDPARILAVASSLRGPDRALESTVEGMSMGRTIPPGSRIRIELVDRHGYDVGEVIAFLAGNQVVVHRVVHRGRGGAARGYVVTRGDAPLAPDPPVDQGVILGAVAGIQRDGRWVALAGRPWQSFRARMVRALLLIAVASLLRMSPRAAQTFATFLQRSEKYLRKARKGTQPRSPQRPVASGAA